MSALEQTIECDLLQGKFVVFCLMIFQNLYHS